MSYTENIKDVIDFLNELQHLSTEDATLSVHNRKQQDEHLMIAYTFSNAAATLLAMSLPVQIAKEHDPSINRSSIIHTCLIQKLLHTIKSVAIQGKVIGEKESATLSNALHLAIETYGGLA